MCGFYLQCEPFVLRFINRAAGDEDPVFTRKLLGCRDFMRRWWACLAGAAARQMPVAVIGWQISDLTSSAWDLGRVGLLVPAALLPRAMALSSAGLKSAINRTFLPVFLAAQVASRTPSSPIDVRIWR